MRPDLALLDAEALAGLSNWGLVKRALRELEQGLGPRLEEREGALLATFPDGTICRLGQGLPLQQSSCSCGSANLCRHRLGMVLALPRRTTEEVPPELRIDPESVTRLVGVRLLQKARRLRDKGLQAELVGPPWQVRLPTNTVRFLAGGDLNYAGCDCDSRGPCEHLAVAAWVALELQGRPGRVDWYRGRGPLSLELTPLFQEGVEATLPQAPPGCTWLQLLLEEMQQLQQAYRQGGAGYDSLRWLSCGLSLWARTRAQGGLSLEARLGSDLPLEQELKQTHLIALGARRQDQDTRVFFADPVGVVLTLAVSDARAADMAYRQLVSRGVVRRADGTLRLRRDPQAHSWLPLKTAWESLKGPVLWEGRLPSRETRLLRPLDAGEDCRVVKLKAVNGIAYLPGTQTLVANLWDVHGNLVELRRAYSARSPGALDVLVECLPRTLEVSGLLSCQQGQMVLEPLALMTAEGLRIPDLEEGPRDWELPWLLERENAHPLIGLLRRAQDLCARAFHLGSGQWLPSLLQDRGALATPLENAGFAKLARLHRLPLEEATFWATALRLHLSLEKLHHSQTR